MFWWSFSAHRKSCYPSWNKKVNNEPLIPAEVFECDCNGNKGQSCNGIYLLAALIIPKTTNGQINQYLCS